MTGATRLHATAVALGGRAALLTGPSGSGKSDLALRLVDAGWRLVADDQTLLWRRGGGVLCRPPERLAGRLEVRGIGIVRMPALAAAPVVLLCRLVPGGTVPRLPEPAVERLLDVPVPVVALAPFEASAPIKLRLAMARVAAGYSATGETGEDG